MGRDSKPEVVAAQPVPKPKRRPPGAGRSARVSATPDPIDGALIDELIEQHRETLERLAKR